MNHLFVSYDKIHKQGKTISHISYIMFCIKNLNLKKLKQLKSLIQQNHSLYLEEWK